MIARVASPGWRGFDCDHPLTAETARLFRAHEYNFAMRYVPRVTPHSRDLTMREVAAIAASGLALGVVQHVESDVSWVPDAAKGIQYGTVAAFQCVALGIAKKTTVWLDLEAVARGTLAGNVIAYCNNWSRAVRSSGFGPGLYFGDHCGLNASQLYYRLTVDRYWRSYNSNDDEVPVIRGACMRQHEAIPKDVPGGITFQIDTNTVMADRLGGLPSFSVANGEVVAS